ncbi:MAG: porphobilinogen synthase [Gammaproteobacteria bacterium]|nr:porphobilinogen synthase [Gammaproteobacteria bacterium]
MSITRGAALSQRRLRQNSHIRELTREVRVSAEQFVQPLFVIEGLAEKQSVPGLNGVYRETIASLITQMEADLAAGISKFLLFGVPEAKALHNFDFSFLSTQVRALKQHFGHSIWLAVDVCLCSSTEHAHCGVINDDGDHVLNGDTVAALSDAAVSYAAAGADCVAPSDMMDGRVAAIRHALDSAGLERTVIMSYSAKFHSGFYGPFRLAADSSPAPDNQLTDRSSYQIDPARPNDALLSSARDADEGADILMVKPGLPYLDVLADLSAEIPLPWAVYHTSGECAALELLAREQLADRTQSNLETWMAFVRAGASIIISYNARFAPEWLSSKT